MRRTSSIAAKFLEMRPDAAILTLSDSRIGQFFGTPQNHDYLKLPSIVKAGPGDWRATNLPLDFESVLEMRQELIRSTLLTFAPHIFLVDHMPHGAMGELLPGLEALKVYGLPTKIVLGLRDILDSSEVIQRRWQEEGAYQAMEKYYDRVLIYGMRDVFDVGEQYQFSASANHRLRYCGYVCTPEMGRAAEKIRARSLAGCPANTKLIVAMAGGGADAYPMMDALLEAFPLIQKQQPSVLLLITGPFLPSDQAANLQKRARHSPIRVMTSVDDTQSYIAASDLVVAMAGYNTSAEILKHKKPAVLVPRRGPSAEQRTRARLFAARHWVDEIDPDELTGPAFSSRILDRMRKGNERPIENRPDLHGLVMASYELLALLSNPGIDSISAPQHDPIQKFQEVRL
jgi:predicted glycosyltransferase